MSKYAPLRDHLLSIKADRWHAKFGEIENLLGFSLPASAYKYPAWWSNDVSGTHTHNKGWRDAGFLTENTNLLRREVTFVRSKT